MFGSSGNLLSSACCRSVTHPHRIKHPSPPPVAVFWPDRVQASLRLILCFLGFLVFFLRFLCIYFGFLVFILVFCCIAFLSVSMFFAVSANLLCVSFIALRPLLGFFRALTATSFHRALLCIGSIYTRLVSFPVFLFACIQFCCFSFPCISLVICL